MQAYSFHQHFVLHERSGTGAVLEICRKLAHDFYCSGEFRLWGMTLCSEARIYVVAVLHGLMISRSC